MGKRCDGFLFEFGDLVCSSNMADDVEKARTHIDVDVCVCVAKYSIYSTELRLADIHRMRCARAQC